MKKAAIISANFYVKISDRLKKFSADYLSNHSCNYDIFDVPGVFEIPAILSFLAKRNLFDLYVIVGCVIRGETAHYEHVTQEVFCAVTNLIIKHELASGMGIVTTNNYEQAVVRSSDPHNNSGKKAAAAAVHMMNLYQNLKNDF